MSEQSRRQTNTDLEQEARDWLSKNPVEGVQVVPVDEQQAQVADNLDRGHNGQGGEPQEL